MVLSNASLYTGIREFARRFSNSNSTNYPDAQLDASINAYYDTFVSEILKSMDDWDFEGEIATASLVANQQEYTFPTDILKVKRVEVSYDGTKWEVVSRFDVNERGEATDSTSVRNDFNVNEPYADLHDNSLFLYPVPTANVSGGLKIFYEKLPTLLSSATDEPSFARPFHKGLAYGAAKDFCEQFPEGRQNHLATNGNNLELTIARMKEFYQKRDQDREYSVATAFVSYDYGSQ